MIALVSGGVIKHPIGGYIYWVLAWMKGLMDSGIETYYVEEAGWEYACYNVKEKTSSDDPSFGIKVLNPIAQKYGFENNWCFKDIEENYHGMKEKEILSVFKMADLFIDLEYDTWKPLSQDVPLRIWVDGEPGWHQARLTRLAEGGKEIPTYDHYFTHGLNVGTDKFDGPTAGIDWHTLCSPVVLDEQVDIKSDKNAPFTTIMSWNSGRGFEYQGRFYGMKDIEFKKFMKLPSLVKNPMEIAVSGPKIPFDELSRMGWIIKDADVISSTLESYRTYIGKSKGEFSVAKNAYVETNAGWFGDRGGYYMFSHRPVVIQDTGISHHIPVGRGLFAVDTVEEAADAITKICMDYEQQAEWAFELVHEYFDAQKVVRRFLNQIGC